MINVLTRTSYPEFITKLSTNTEYPKKCVLIDLRKSDMFKKEAIEIDGMETINIPVFKLTHSDNINRFANKNLILYCNSGVVCRNSLALIEKINCKSRSILAGGFLMHKIINENH